MKEASEKILTSAVSCLHLNGPDNRWCVGATLVTLLTFETAARFWSGDKHTPTSALAQSCWRMMEAG